MKKKIIATILLCTMLLTGCSRQSNQGDTQDTQDVQDTLDTQDTTEQNETLKPATHTLYWGIYDFSYRVNEKAVESVNQILLEMGRDYRVELILLPMEDYQNSICTYEEKNGSLDIVNSGITFAGDMIDYSYNLIREGYFEPLTDRIAADTALTEHFSPKLLKAMEVNGTVYTLPNEAFPSTYYVYYFNRDYFTEEEIENFSGKIEDLQTFFEQIPCQEGFCHFINELGYKDYLSMNESEYSKGVILDYADSAVISPLSYTPLISYLDTIGYYKKQGYLQPGYDIAGSTCTDEMYQEYVASGNVAVFAGGCDGFYTIENELLNTDQYSKVIFPGTMHAMTGGTTGIAAGSDYKEDAFDFLSLAYTDSAIANLLLWGIEGEDYQLIDGEVYGMDGSPASNFTASLCTGILQSAYIPFDIQVDTDITEYQKSFYEQYTILSPFNGFQFNTSGEEKALIRYDAILRRAIEGYGNAEKPEQFLQEKIEELNQIGYEEYRLKMEEQVKTWLEGEQE